MAHRGEDLVPLHGVEIEVMARRTGGLSQPHRIDVVGSFLEGLYTHALGAEGRAQAERHGGLAGGFVGGGDEQMGHFE